MELPPGYNVDKGLRHAVVKLQVALYGSKQGALRWYLELCGSLRELRLKCAHSNWGVFYAHIGCNILILMSHVDDCTLTSSSHELMGLFKDEIWARYKITDLGPISWVLGMKVVQDHVAQTVSLSQEPYIDAIITKYNFSDGYTSVGNSKECQHLCPVPVPHMSSGSLSLTCLCLPMYHLTPDTLTPGTPLPHTLAPARPPTTCAPP